MVMQLEEKCKGLEIRVDELQNQLSDTLKEVRSTFWSKTHQKFASHVSKKFYPQKTYRTLPDSKKQNPYHGQVSIAKDL